ncbi:type II secretion system ATPase GspE [Huaxiibacter chinensis]
MSGELFPWRWVQQHGVLPVVDHPSPQLYVHAASDLSAIAEALRVLPGARVNAVTSDVFAQQVSACYQQNDASHQVMTDMGNEFDLHELVESLPEDNELLDSDDGAPVVRLINAILSEAVREGASDVHIEPFEKLLIIRFRIDGMLRQVLTPPVQLSRYLISRIKVMAKLDIAEKRLPQDGRISLRLAGRTIDVRVSTLPASHGERVVLRILDKGSAALTLEHSGMNLLQRESLQQQLQLPHGIILVTGPTGSGKSTTLYAALRTLYRPEKNVLTIEDPVEYELEGIGQTQVNARIDMTFARGLRAILRQDPDVVMIGEIRDAETAQIAVQASLTGHLVLSSLHTNSALGAVIRLRDMGIESFLLANALSALLAQRLVRKLCPDCRKPYRPAPHLLAPFVDIPSVSAARFWMASGCEACKHSGYRGRVGMFELIIVTDALRQAISQDQHEQQLQHILHQTRIPLLHDGLEKAKAGLTTLEEVLRVSKAGG